MLSNFLLFQFGRFAFVLGGARLGAMEFAAPVAATAALAVGWAVLTPLLVWLARHFDGYPAANIAAMRPEPRHA